MCGREARRGQLEPAAGVEVGGEDDPSVVEPLLYDMIRETVAVDVDQRRSGFGEAPMRELGAGVHVVGA